MTLSFYKNKNFIVFKQPVYLNLTYTKYYNELIILFLDKKLKLKINKDIKLVVIKNITTKLFFLNNQNKFDKNLLYILHNKLLEEFCLFKETIKINGTNFYFLIKENLLVINAGFAKLININIPSEISISSHSSNTITFISNKKQLLGNFIYKIYNIFPRNDYKDLGITILKNIKPFKKIKK